MTSTQLMIQEATIARDEIAAELRAACASQSKGGHVDAEWMADRIDSLAYYNRLLVNLGAIPA